MEIVDLLATGTVLGWFLILSLVVIALVLFVYHLGSQIDDDMERKYAMLGTVGGKAEKSEEESENEDLMDYEKLEEKDYPNDQK